MRISLKFVAFCFLQVKAAVAALWNTRGLNWPSAFEQSRQKAGDLDLLDWLRAMFGFQVCIKMRDEVMGKSHYMTFKK